MLAPKAEVSMFPWKEPKERIPLVRAAKSIPSSRRIGLRKALGGNKAVDCGRRGACADRREERTYRRMRQAGRRPGTEDTLAQNDLHGVAADNLGAARGALPDELERIVLSLEQVGRNRDQDRQLIAG